MSDDPLTRPLRLRSGVVVPGRVVKAAMTEGVADESNRATGRHAVLYEQWARGHGAGHLLITGNVAVDRRYVERPGNVVIEGTSTSVDEEHVEALRRWARAAQTDGTVCFVQLSHAGLQANPLVSSSTVGPSAVRVKMSGWMPLAEPAEMTVDEIKQVRDKFVAAAEVCRRAGFSGVQIHSAHGYLLSSFLTPRFNKRTDQYGGSLENRARLLLEIVRGVRVNTESANAAGGGGNGKPFGVAVKLNSSDFQRGGMTPEEAAQIAQWLDEEGIDFLEASGGNYESPAMFFAPGGFEEIQSLGNLGKLSSTQLREGYFLGFAPLLKKSLAKNQTPLMVTGGFRSRDVMEKALQSGEVDLVGIGRPVCGQPDAVARLLRREISSLPRWESELDLPWYLRPLKAIIIGHVMQAGTIWMWTYDSLVRMATGKAPETTDADLIVSLTRIVAHEMDKARSLRGVDTEGLVTNARPLWQWPVVRRAVVAVLVLVVAVRQLRRLV